MIFFIIILIALMCAGLKVAGKNEFFNDYCSPKNTSTANAIISVLIFLSHSVQYLSVGGIFDDPYLSLRKFLGQLVVVTYLFFSGYGIMVSIQKKGTPYVKRMPVDRLFKTWYHFAIVIIMFLIVQVGICAKEYDIKQILLAFTGYRAVGNSNWYMFVTFALYIIVIISFIIFKKHKWLGVAAVWALAVLFIVWERNAGLTKTYYNTLLCFPLGMFFAMVKPQIDKVFMKNDVVWFVGFAICAILFAYFALNRDKRLVYYILFTFTAIAMLLMFMMKVNISHSVFDWFGRHIFSFFILQRIPMILLKNFGYAKNTMFFIIIAFISTVLLATIFDEATDKLDKVIFKAKSKKN